MAAGLRASAKALEHPPEPNVGAPVLDPTDQHDVLVQLLREPIEASYEAPSDDQLVTAADLVFLEYDKAEKAS